MSTSPENLTAALLTAKQAADYLSLSENMIKKLVYAREIPCVKIGASLRFLQADLDAFIMRSRIESA